MANKLRDRMIDEVIRVEGGYVDDPDDSGGETKFGITVKVARAYGYQGEMVDLTRSFAFEIYVDMYWTAIKGDHLAAISELIAEEVMDTGVNMGINRSGKFLQRALNALNNKDTLYDDVVVDGIIGSGTVKALGKFMDTRREDDVVLAKVLNCLQGAKYVSLAENREKDETHLYGWFKNRVEI